MNAGNVAAFGCGRAHPQHGDRATCVRQRHHAGDHRAEHRGRLITWPDPPLGDVWPPLDHGDDLSPGPWGLVDELTRGLVVVVLVLLALAGPPALVLLYRAL